MAVVTRGRRHKEKFPQPTPTSMCFQEALRLCGEQQEDTLPCCETEDEMDPCEDYSSQRLPSSEDRRGAEGPDLADSVPWSQRDRSPCASRLQARDHRGGQLHVQWADEQQRQLVRERPRKRYDRRPSWRVSAPPKSILKRRGSVP